MIKRTWAKQGDGKWLKGGSVWNWTYVDGRDLTIRIF